MCTGIRFNDNKGNMYFGRNLDWSVGYGQKVVITPRGYELNSAFLGKLSVKYAIIGMGIVQQDIPLYFDCGNEAGLAIAGLNFPGYASYEEKAVDGKTNVAAYEFPLWVAMNFSSVDEVEKELKNVAIVAKPINDKFPVSMLHWIIGDGTRSIAVEYTKNSMEIFDDDVDVLANQPGFGWHRENQTEARTYLLDVPNKKLNLVESRGFNNKFSQACGSFQNLDNDVIVIGWGWATTDNECMSVFDRMTREKLMSVTLENPQDITYRCVYYE